MHPDWLSNSFVIADREGGTAVFVDSGADVAPLVQSLRDRERAGHSSTIIVVAEGAIYLRSGSDPERISAIVPHGTPRPAANPGHQADG